VPAFDFLHAEEELRGRDSQKRVSIQLYAR